MSESGRGLRWLGDCGVRAVAASAVLGLLLPGLSSVLRPMIGVAIFMLLVLAFLRVDPQAVIARVRKPTLVLVSAVWIMLAVPLFAALLMHATGLNARSPGLMLAVFIVTAAPPVMSAPAFAALMGLDGALSLTVLIAATALTPLTAPLIAGVMLDAALPISALSLALRLVALLAGSMALSWVIRRLATPARLVVRRREIDGLNVILLFGFIIAAMDGVASRFLIDPLLVLGIAALSFGVAFTQIALTMLALPKAASSDAFVVAHAAGNRNMGLMVAALGGSLPDLAWLYFALGQLPIYLLPLMLKPLAARMLPPLRNTATGDKGGTRP
ncbi:sodium:proton symporter [Breoghania sp. L-A4]|uniref:sodium:proton symporter n=1 Tax=Breoghania sp. L-A4 TaxID=2304600 RepID=UPI000E3609DF|nr:sodium:proton symporter [Breoghania sp. L-A4]AXS41150.1 sodium:proton symporter [Breoghania sp. L-A4]